MYIHVCVCIEISRDTEMETCIYRYGYRNRYGSR